MRHIRKPVTLPPEKAEKIYVASEGVRELAELINNESAPPWNLLIILADQLSEGISDVHFPFED